MESLFLSYILAYQTIGYILAFFGMIIGGDEVLFIAAFLTREGYFSVLIMSIVLFIGVFIGDYFWYWLGKTLLPETMFQKWVAKLTSRFDDHIMEKPLRTLIISKFIYCFNHAILIRAGSRNLSKNIYLKNNTIAIIIWIIVVGGLGYFSSASLSLIKRFIQYTEFGLLIGLVVFLLIEKGIQKLLKKGL